MHKKTRGKPAPTPSAIAFEQIQKAIDIACKPDTLTKHEYKETLERLKDDIDGRLEAVNAELGEIE